MSEAKWIGSGYEKPQAWLFKKDMPTHLQYEARRINFGLHGLAWVAIDQNGDILMRDNSRMQTFEFYLTTPGHVVGPRDAKAAWNMPWAIEWQGACCARRLGDCTGEPLAPNTRRELLELSREGVICNLKQIIRSLESKQPLDFKSLVDLADELQSTANELHRVANYDC